MSFEFANEYSSRVYSTIGNPPFLASYMLMLIFVGFILFFNAHKKYYRYLYVLPVSLYFVTIYYTASRGAILAALTGLIICSLFVFTNKDNKCKKITFNRVVMPCIAIIIIVMVFFMMIKHSDFVKHDETLSRFTNLYSDPSIKTRLNAWKMAWNGVKERPILGWGQENLVGIYTVNPIPAYEGLVFVDRAHNIIIDWLINAGFLGLFSYLMILGYSLYIVWTSYHRKKSITKSVFVTLFTALSVYFIQNLFTFDTINTYVLFFTLLAYLDGFDRKNNESVSEIKVDTVIRNAKVKSISLTFLALLMFLSLTYYVNYKPIKASQYSVKISKAFPQYKSFTQLMDDFNKVLSYETFGKTDVRIRMAETSSQIIKFKLFDFEGGLDFIQWTIEELEKGIQDNYHNLDYLSNTIKLYYQVAREEPSFIASVEKLIESVLLINPEYEWLYYKLADVNLLKKDHEKAFKIIYRVVAKDSQNDRQQLKLAEVAILDSREDVAVRALEQVENIRRRRKADIYADKKNFYSEHELYMLAKAYREAANYHKALKYFQKVVELSPENAQYHFEISQIYMKLGDKKNAAIEAHKAERLDPLNYSGKAREID
jgi:tetratricopeptide (TPR) repeat protein